jgi:hypothetical protein
LSSIIDPVNLLGYFGCAPSPSIVVKFSLKLNLYRLAGVTASGADNSFRSAAISSSNTIGYFATDIATGVVVKFFLPTLTRLSAVSGNSGDDYLRGLVIDDSNNLLYAATYTTPGSVEVQFIIDDKNRLCCRKFWRKPTANATSWSRGFRNRKTPTSSSAPCTSISITTL